MEYEVLPVSWTLILEDHQGVGSGRDAATCWLADKGPEDAVSL